MTDRSAHHDDEDDDDFVVPIDYVRDPGRTGPEIHAALAPENREVFEAEWAEAVRHAARTYDLAPAQRLLERWWAVAAVNNTPELEADIARTLRRIAAGKETFTYVRMPGQSLPPGITDRDKVADWPLVPEDDEEP